MSDDVIIGIDAGTSVIKAVAFDQEGRQLLVTSRPNVYACLPGGAVEQGMARTWSDTTAVLRELVERLPGGAARVAALGVTGQGDGTWLVDADGEPVGDGWLWLDSRSADIVAELEANGARRRIYERTGCALTVCNQSSHLVWLDRHAPDLLARATTALHCKDWLFLNLTGERVTDTAEGTFTFGDFRTRAYAPEVLDALGIAHLRRLLPPMIDGSRETRPLSAAGAAATGLRQGLPVALGYLDVVCTALGAGIDEPRSRVGVSIAGSTGMHMRLLGRAQDVMLADEPTGYTMPFMIPETVLQMQSNMAATLNIDWLVDLGRGASALLGNLVERQAALAAVDAQVLNGRPGAAVYHPYIHQAGERGPFADSNARAQITGLTHDVGYLDLVRSAYEGLAFAARDCYSAMGGVPDEIRIAGGAARSRAFKTILASVLDAPVRESAREEAGAAGCAMMAAVATGAHADIPAACAVWVEPLLGEHVRPDPALRPLYDALFPLYVEGHRGKRAWWAELARVRKEMQ